MTARAHHHAAEELCEKGLELYTRALRAGHVSAHEAEPVPCLLDAGLLEPDFETPARLRPVTPTVALTRLLRTVEEDIARRRRQESRLAETFAPLLSLTLPESARAQANGIRMLTGLDQINSAITDAMETASDEILTVQPHGAHVTTAPELLAQALRRDQAFLDRGGRIRTLYQHTTRHLPTLLARYEALRGDAEARTLDEVTKRLVIIDRTVAYLPGNADRTLALEVRIPALVDFLATAFERLWSLAVPMYPQTVRRPTLNGITPRQRAIARLLVEGHTDAVIAERLGMNIRTARVHIAKLAATLGSDSRAQLGYLIAESGIFQQDGGDGP